MEIVHVYTKQRREFGRRCDFVLSEFGTIVDKPPDPKKREEYVVRNPCSVGCACIPTMSHHEENTVTTQLKDIGMNHFEGGWPKDVNIEDVESKKRFLKKMEGEERYCRAVSRLAHDMNIRLRQNCVLDIYEDYFSPRPRLSDASSRPSSSSGTLPSAYGTQQRTSRPATGIGAAVLPGSSHGRGGTLGSRGGTSLTAGSFDSYEVLCEQPGANIVTVMKDPKSIDGGSTRTAARVTWLPTDGSKLAVAFCSYSFRQFLQRAKAVGASLGVPDVISPAPAVESEFEGESDLIPGAPAGSIPIQSVPSSVSDDIRAGRSSIYSFPVESYVWDLHNTNSPESTLLPPGSPLTCLEFNPKDPSLIVGGCYNGQVCLFDLRIRPDVGPVLRSPIAMSHKDPVFDVKWIQSKNSTQFLTTSPDGMLYVWDIKKATNPEEKLAIRRQIEYQEKQRLQKQKSPLYGGETLYYDLNVSATKFMVGTEQGAILACTRRKNKPIFIEKIYEGHTGPVYSVKRNPDQTLNKYFMSIGDWTVKIWNEEISYPIVETQSSNVYLTDGCWSPSRPSVFFTANMNGFLNVWDLGYNQSIPLFSLHVATGGLHCLRPHAGQRLACGSSDGLISVVRLNEALSGSKHNEPIRRRRERELVKTILDRETKRESMLLQTRREIRAQQSAASKSVSRSTRVVLEEFSEDFESLIPMPGLGEEEEGEVGEDVPSEIPVDLGDDEFLDEPKGAAEDGDDLPPMGEFDGEEEF